ncbi:MAG: DUF4139 domain-containing protein [Clostridiaceae bacterium]
MRYTSTMEDTREISITVYNNGFGVVKEIRKIDVSKDTEVIQYLDVAQLIEIDSIIVQGVDVLELNYDYDLVNKEKLMEKYLDKNVVLHDKIANTKDQYRLLSVKGGIVLENEVTKEIVINPEGEIMLPKLPGELIVKPALIWKIHPAEAEKIKVSYITKGLTWTSNYIVILKEKDFILAGWINIENNSGTSYEKANLKLIAGEVKRVEEYNDKDDTYLKGYKLYSEANSVKFIEKSFLDYHMYTLQHITDLKNNQSKQVNFIDADHVGYYKYYDFGDYGEKFSIMIEFENQSHNGLGIPIPKGKIKVYKEDGEEGNLEFIGEDKINHTPKDEKITLNIGEAFDVVCERVRLSYKKCSGYDYEEYEFKIRNHKDEEIKVKINHHIIGDWQMIHFSDEYIKENSQKITFWVKARANEGRSIVFKYKVNKRTTVEIK